MTLLVAFGCAATTFGDAAVEYQRYKEISLSALHFFQFQETCLERRKNIGDWCHEFKIWLQLFVVIVLVLFLTGYLIYRAV